MANTIRLVNNTLNRLHVLNSRAKSPSVYFNALYVPASLYVSFLSYFSLSLKKICH